MLDIYSFLFYLTVILGIAVVALAVLLLIERGRKEKPVQKIEEKSGENLVRGWSWPISKTVSDEVVENVKNRLRVLEIEREILSYAIRRLYEAQAEGKITAEERDNLILKYKDDLERVKQEIARGESIIALNELEKMQEEFVKMFSEKFEALTKRIEELKAIANLAAPTSRLVVEPVKAPKEEVEKKVEKTPTPKRKKEKAKPKEAAEQPSPRNVEKSEEIEETEDEQDIRQIVAEVEKVLSKLSQMEIEE
ncbi:hypothetical protein J7L29_08940 [Candidatus Bathyarchaeota archaeon]|nr:hypothetical protein [Candidatus Bathyarchaeota archaeon]